MSKSLIIVESPAKIKTLKKFLGPKYIFESSVGHIRDLPEKEFGIDIENDFEPKYTIMPTKEQVIAKLKKAAKECDTVYLSPDPDREGEAIAWHIAQILPKDTNIKRVSFNSITKDAVIAALKQPREIDIALVNAQQARRMLDRIVGYKISPLLNRRIQRGISAGRVQSVALKLVVEREKEIEAFKPVEFWNIGAILRKQKEEKTFRAALYSVDGKRIEKEPVPGKEVAIVSNKAEADAVLKKMKAGPYIVDRVEKKEKKRNPVPPFITSTLQQEASRHHGFSAAKTMNIAQGLYEGVDLGQDGPEGLITYMRTDSVRIAPEAVAEARAYILAQYGQEYLPAEPKIYSSQKSAQDAHEAIRPANLNYPPETIQQYLTREQFMLYKLIWRRLLASQMMPAVYDTVSADITAGGGVMLRATGSTIKFSGFLAVYEEKYDDDEENDDNRTLPNLEEKQQLDLQELTSEQAFTRPPPRYTEASLVKELEKSGIGRPSTYATIMNKIQSREYTIKETGRLRPTELGRIISQMLEENFKQIMNIGFTAMMEDGLELVAENKKEWKVLLREFWDQFSPTLEAALKDAHVPKVMTDLICPKCGGKLQKIWAKSKYFYGCSNYPECDYSAPLEQIGFDKEDYASDFNWDQPCPICQSEMKVRHGRYGSFLGCTKYPQCKGVVKIPKKGEAVISMEGMPSCPAIDCPGQMVPRKSRFGKTFYSCSTFPECDVIVNDLDDLESKYPDHPRTPFQKKSKYGAGKKGSQPEKVDKETKATTKKPKAVAKKTRSSKVAEKAPKSAKSSRQAPMNALSSELASLVGTNELSRGQVMKKVWEYIKSNDLQDKENKRLIVPDERLGKVLGTQQPVDMFKMTSLISKHIG